MSIASARAPGKAATWGALGLAAALILNLSTVAALAAAPQIRTSAANTVPRCVTPQRLMAFLKQRNPHVAPRFANIAAFYKRYGERWHVRWDYAFFQMAVETNFLSFKRGNGDWGDVKPRQNNFAGLGTTGGGVPGDSYPDVDTGVLAQIQHLVVYSGEHVANPVGHRTKLKQDDIIETVARFKGRTTFSDLSRRWAADRHYGAAIEWVAGKYRATYCTQSAAAEQERTPRPTRAHFNELVAKTTTRLAAATAALPPAAGLGGPGSNKGDAGTPPVRTIWSRSAQPAPPASAAERPVPAATRPATRTVTRSPALPEEARSPAANAVQPAQAAAKAPIVVPAPVEVRPAPRPALPHPALQPASSEESRAFSFAAAMVAAASAASANNAAPCRVFSASYGGTKTLLVRAEAGSELHYTALTVLEGFEDSMLAGYLKAHAPGGSSIGTFDTRDAALAKAGEPCPGTGNAPQAEDEHAG